MAGRRKKQPTVDAHGRPRHRDLGLGIYRKVYRRMWRDQQFCKLSPLVPSGQALWMWLVSGPETGTIPGTVIGKNRVLAAVLEWPLDAFMDAFAEASAMGMAEADFGAGLVWLPNGLKHNPPASLNVAKAWGKAVRDLPECDLKSRVISDVISYLREFGDDFVDAFRMASPLTSAKGSGASRQHSAGSSGSPQPPSRGAVSDSNPTEPEQAPSSDTTVTGDISSPVPDEPPFELRSDRAGHGCTVCGDKLPGVVFRRGVQDEPMAGMCWGCDNLGYPNPWDLPVPNSASRADWGRFEHIFPENKGMRKRERAVFEQKAVDGTHKFLRAREMSGEEPPRDQCEGCDGEVAMPGLLFHEDSPDHWAAGLCATCGGSTLYADPPAFVGKPLPIAEGNGWVTIGNTPAADLDDRSAWIADAVTWARRPATGTQDSEPEAPEAPPEPAEPDSPKVAKLSPPPV